MKDSLIIIFSRAPIIGKVKKRLAKNIGRKAALEVHNKLFTKTMKTVEHTSVNYKLYFSEEAPEELRMPYLLQDGKDLGEKMANAIRAELRTHDRVCLIGSDCLDLEYSDLLEAFSLLDKHDLVFGPAQDGGYYLVALGQNYPTLFKDINWGSATVLEESIRAAENLGLRVAFLKTRNDVDTVDDLPTDWLSK